ncbi:MAG: hypothetical protein CVT78_07755 [Alphaproteobacteria bacterium HGW-Alphaproteobacteria-17]|nr:MAG: hypothetical protein CVT78_07755 [Alphaproteobacteria bacterium HGW-Alphaproteobacteria-17]
MHMKERVRQACEEKQARIQDLALSLALPDAVFTILFYNDHNRRMGPFPFCDPIPLTILEQAFGPFEVEIWRSRASALLQEACVVGDAWFGDDATYARMRAEYEAKHPGFSADTYKDAVHYGIWQAR